MKKSLLFCFLKCYVDMCQRPDIRRLMRETTTESARAEKVALHPSHAEPNRQRQGVARGLVGVMMQRG